MLNKITVNDFKTQFPRWTPSYLPVYVLGNTYFKNDIVFYNNLFYKCKVANTTSTPDTASDWELYNTSVLQYTQDSDILSAFREANTNFNEGLYGDNAILIFLYLTAFYLTMDFQNATGNNSTGLVSSKSVGSVSESYALPQWMLNSPTLSIYATNGYGRKYLSMIKPYLSGNIMLVKGRSTIA